MADENEKKDVNEVDYTALDEVLKEIGEEGVPRGKKKYIYRPGRSTEPVEGYETPEKAEKEVANDNTDLGDVGEYPPGSENYKEKTTEKGEEEQEQEEELPDGHFKKPIEQTEEDKIVNDIFSLLDERINWEEVRQIDERKREDDEEEEEDVLIKDEKIPELDFKRPPIEKRISDRYNEDYTEKNEGPSVFEKYSDLMGELSDIELEGQEGEQPTETDKEMANEEIPIVEEAPEEKIETDETEKEEIPEEEKFEVPEIDDFDELDSDNLAKEEGDEIMEKDKELEETEKTDDSLVVDDMDFDFDTEETSEEKDTDASDSDKEEGGGEDVEEEFEVASDFDFDDSIVDTDDISEPVADKEEETEEIPEIDTDNFDMFGGTDDIDMGEAEQESLVDNIGEDIEDTEEEESPMSDFGEDVEDTEEEESPMSDFGEDVEDTEEVEDDDDVFNPDDDFDFETPELDSDSEEEDEGTEGDDDDNVLSFDDALSEDSTEDDGNGIGSLDEGSDVADLFDESGSDAEEAEETEEDVKTTDSTDGFGFPDVEDDFAEDQLDDFSLSTDSLGGDEDKEDVFDGSDYNNNEEFEKAEALDDELDKSIPVETDVDEDELEEEFADFQEEPEEAHESDSESIELSEEEFDLVKKRLQELPEPTSSEARDTIIGEKLNKNDMRKLIDLLIKKKPYTEVQNYLDKKLKKKKRPALPVGVYVIIATVLIGVIIYFSLSLINREDPINSALSGMRGRKLINEGLHILNTTPGEEGIREAEEIFQKAIKENPNDISYYNDYAEMFLRRNEPEQAKKYLIGDVTAP